MVGPDAGRGHAHRGPANSKVMPTWAANSSPGLPATNQNLPPTGQLLTAPGAFQTVYSPALVETDPRFGTEGALSQFDAQLSTSMFWERNDRPVNLAFTGLTANIFEQDLGTFRAEVGKRTATGGQLFLRQNTSYEWNNNPANTFPSVYNADIEAEFRHPLLQGAGVEFNRNAGPNSAGHLQRHHAGADQHGHRPDRLRSGRAAARERRGAGVLGRVLQLPQPARRQGRPRQRLGDLAASQGVVRRKRQGGRGGQGSAGRRAILSVPTQVESTWSNLYVAEHRLRYMMGLSPTDGRMIRSIDEPTTASVQFDYNEIMLESLTRSVEVRRQKWGIKHARAAAFGRAISCCRAWTP